MKRITLITCLAAIMPLATAASAFAADGTIYGKAVLAPYALTITGGGTTPDLARPVTLIALPLVSVSGRAVTMLGSTTQTLVFSEVDIANHTVQAVSSSSLTPGRAGAGRTSLSSRARGQPRAAGGGENRRRAEYYQEARALPRVGGACGSERPLRVGVILRRRQAAWQSRPDRAAGRAGCHDE